MTAADTIKDLRVAVKRCPSCGTGFGVDAAFCPFDGIALETGTWDPTRDPLTNAIVDQRYEVIAPLGEGGMGTVYKVRHVTLDRMFAMKVLRRDLAADEGLAARFMQEARATAAIHHPSVVAITDFGSLEDGAPYFVMELLVGETLATRMRARGLLPPQEAAGIAKKLAEALGAAHAAKVVHRDLKPENVFLVGAASGKAPYDELRIVDFGAAKVVGASKLTRPGVVFGTPYYMSPEQASGQPVDARADIYSLGVLLYEMLSGVLPFEADTYMGVLTKHMFATAPVPSSRVPSGAPLGALDGVVMRALEKEPANRYPSMVQFAEAIERAVAERASATPVASPRSPSGRPLTGVQLSAADRIQRSVSRHVVEEERRKRRAIAIGVVAAVTTIGVGALALSLVDHRTPASGSGAAMQLQSTTQATSAAAPTTMPPASAPIAPVATSVGAAVPEVPASATTPAASAVSVASPVASTVAVVRPAPRPPAPIAPATRDAHPTTSARPPPPPPPRGGGDFTDPWAR